MKKKLNILSLILCFFAAVSVFMVFPCPGEPAACAGEGALRDICINLFLSTKDNAFPIMLGFAALLCLRRRSNTPDGFGVLAEAVCFLIAAVWLFGQAFRIDNTLDELSKGPGQLVKCLIYLLGSYYLLRQISVLALGFLDSGRDIRPNRLTQLIERRSFGFFAVSLFVCCLPTWIVCYPGYMLSDAYCQLAYYFGIYSFVSHHPPVHTLLISWPVRLGMLLGSANFGLYLAVCVQFIIFILVFAYLLHTMVKLSAPSWLVLLGFLTVALSPAYVTVASYILKDNVYSYGVVLFVTELVYLLRLRDEYWKGTVHPLLLSVSVLMIMLLRNNGKYMLYLLIPVLVIVAFVRGRKRGSMRSAALLALELVLSVALSVAIQSAVVSYYNVAPGSRREALSLPFQQTARYIFERGDSITDEEREAIDRVISFDDIGREYDPMISDPVKQYFNDECTASDILGYLKVWLRQGLRAPHVYFKATVNQNYPLLCPWVIQDYTNLSTESPLHYHISQPLGLHDVDVADALEDKMSAVNSLLSVLPVPGLSSNLPLCCIILLVLCSVGAARKKTDFLLCALPSLITFGTVVLAPLVDPRYAFPIIYTMPLLLAVFLRPDGGDI